MRWLPCDKVLEKFVTPIKAVREFLMQKLDLAEKLVDQKWLLFVAHLSNVFSPLNILGQSLQGPNTMLVNVSKKLTVFHAKTLMLSTNICCTFLTVWHISEKLRKINKCQKTATFPVFHQFLDIRKICVLMISSLL